MPATYTDSIDGLTTSVAEKAPVVVATNGAITLSGEQTVNGVACVEGDRVLVKDQDDSTTNGIYVCSDSAWSRALDFNGNRDVVKGTSVRVAGPSVSTGSLYIVTTENPIVIGTSAIVFVQKPEGTSDSTQFVSMEDLRVSTTDQDYVETLAFYASGTTGSAKLYRDGTGTPTGSGAAVIAAALAAGTFCNAAGHCYKLRIDQEITQYTFGCVGGGIVDDYLFLAAAAVWCSARGAELTGYPGIHRVTQTVEITAAMAFRAKGIAGPRVYANPAAAYGGCEIFLDVSGLSTADRTLKSSFALAVDTGAIGSEGYARVVVDGIGFSWGDPHAGGVYIEGAAHVDVGNCWLNGGLTAYNAGTLDGFAVYCRDAIQSKIHDNDFRYVGYGIVGDEYFNEDCVYGNNFDKVAETAVLVRGSSSGIRSSIRENNIIDAEYGVVVVGQASSVYVGENTLEIIRRTPVTVTDTDPISGLVIGVPRNVSTMNNAFIACNIEAVGPLIQYNACAGGAIGGNESRSPTGNTNCMVNVGTPCSDIVLHPNDYGALTYFLGNIAKVLPSVPYESSYTPTVTFGGGSTGITYGAQVGIASKVGNLVHVQVHVTLTAKGSSTGTLAVSLPYTSRNTSGLYSTAATHISNLSGVAGDIQVYVLNNSASAVFVFLGTGSQSNLTDANATNTTEIIFTISYLV